MRVAAVCLWLAAPAFAQSEGFRMLNDSSNPFPYYVDGRSQSPTSNLSLNDIEAATDSAWQTWQAVPCNDDAFVDLGPTTNNPAITDPENIYGPYNISTVWITDAGDPYYAYALVGQVVGIALPQAYGGVLQNCDIFLNGVDFTWSTDGGAPTASGGAGWADVQTIVLHESGHCQGLGHTDNPSDVMYPYEALETTKRILAADDVQQVCSIAPKSGAVGSPCQATPDCQSGSLTCVAPPLPDGGTAEPLCSEPCDPDAGVVQCPSPFVCEYSSLIAGSPGSCLPPSDNAVTRVGAACQQNGDCGAAAGVCTQPSSLPSGAVGWVEGYCTQPCGAQLEACPADALCTSYEGAQQCLATCRPGSADCRPYYSCEVIGSQGVCVPSCGGDADCPSGSRCRTCDGQCLPDQNPAGQLGDVCTSAAVCGAGQICLGVGSNPAYGVCASACGNACSACPAGGSCLPLGNDGSLWCLLDCTGTPCPQGLYCGQTNAGPACLPATCTTVNDCPVGDACVGGVCENPYADGGTPDGGAADGGGTGGGKGGCGCSGAAAGAEGLLLLVTLATLRRRRAWASR